MFLCPKLKMCKNGSFCVSLSSRSFAIHHITLPLYPGHRGRKFFSESNTFICLTFPINVHCFRDSPTFCED